MGRCTSQAVTCRSRPATSPPWMPQTPMRSRPRSKRSWTASSRPSHRASACASMWASSMRWAQSTSSPTATCSSTAASRLRLTGPSRPSSARATPTRAGASWTSATASHGAHGCKATRTRLTGCGTCGAASTLPCRAAWSRPLSAALSMTAPPGRSPRTPTSTQRARVRSARRSSRSLAFRASTPTSSTVTSRCAPSTARAPSRAREGCS